MSSYNNVFFDPAPAAGERFTLWRTRAIKEDMSGVKSLTALSGSLNMISHGNVEAAPAIDCKCDVVFIIGDY